MRKGQRYVLLGVFLLVALAMGAGWPLAARGSDWWQVSFQQRWALLLLPLAPLVLWRSTVGADARLPRMLLGTTAPFRQGPVGLRARMRDLPGAFRAVAVALLILALARPVSLLRPSETSESGIDIVLVLDLSGSMKAVMDGQPIGVKPTIKGKRPTRIDVAKDVIRDFIHRRKTDRIGAVVFGRSAYVLAPPTLDYQLLDTLISGIELDMIDSTGTAIGDALGTGAARLRRSNARSKAIVLLTDGDSNAGSIAPEYGAHLAQSVGAKVYTIQIGSGDDVDVQDGVDIFGQPKYVRAHFPVNPELLQKIASSTGGEFYLATDADALRKSMHDVLDRLEKTRFESQLASYEDLFPLLLLPGTLLLALDALLRSWLLRRFP
ncbi:MAG: VWA domain-containing protein [Myxococcales bacterium]|nr:VWA domain-containing protein [Polyangiaceae bacterium]MDW8251482.1 VWA domain-containing protein [Myxococcales bacterium]